MKRVIILFIVFILAIYLIYVLINQSLASYYLKKGRIYTVMNNYKLAEYFYKKAIHCNPSQKEAHFYYGILKKEQNDLITSYNELKEAREYITDLNLDINLAEVCIKLGKLEEARSIYENIIDTYMWNEYMLVSYINLGRIYLKEGKKEKAKECFEKAKEFTDEDEKIDKLIESIQ